YLHVAKFVERLCQTYVVENLQNRWMDGVTTEFTVEILVRLQQRDRNAFPCQQQGKHHAAGATSDDATGGLLRINGLFSDFGLRERDHFCSHNDPPSRKLERRPLYTFCLQAVSSLGGSQGICARQCDNRSPEHSRALH